MNKESVRDYKRLRDASRFISNFLYLVASLTLMVAAFTMVGKAIYDLYKLLFVEFRISKSILDAISYTIIAIAVFDVGRYLIEEEVQRDKELRSPSEARRTLTRFMVVITIALALEGLVGVFEAGNRDVTEVLYPLALVISAVVVMVGLGVYQRMSLQTERELLKSAESSNRVTGSK